MKTLRDYIATRKAALSQRKDQLLAELNQVTGAEYELNQMAAQLEQPKSPKEKKP